MKKRILYSLLATMSIQPFVFIAVFFATNGFFDWGLLMPLAVYSLAAVPVAAACFVVIWVPIFLLLEKYEKANWISICLVALMIFTVPTAIVNWPESYRDGTAYEARNGRREYTMFKGQPTPYAWRRYFLEVGRFGAQGLFGALTFYFVWNRSKPGAAQQQTAPYTAA